MFISCRYLAVAACASILLAGPAAAAVYTWNVVDGGSWGTTTGWDLNNGNYPKAPGDTARVFNNLPSNWSAGVSNFDINVTDINGANLEIEDNVLASGIRLRVNEDATFNRIDSKSDGSTRNELHIANGKTLTVNFLNFTGNYNAVIGPSTTTGTLKFNPVNGEATFNYVGFNDNNRFDIRTVDFSHSALATMNIGRNAGGAAIESMNSNWLVGRGTGGGDQIFAVTGGMLKHESRSNGTFVRYVKVGDGLVDMGARTSGTPSDGIHISRGNIDNPVTGQGWLFTDASGNAATGSARIANYSWRMTRDSTTGSTIAHTDRVGADLTITAGGTLTLHDTGSTATSFDDVNAFWILPGKTVSIEGATGHLRILDDITNATGTTSTGRMGVYFAGATVNVGGNLETTGNSTSGTFVSQTFLNDGGTASALNVGGNVIIRSRNAAGFASISNAGSLPGGAAFDDFNLGATTLTMNGGSARSLTWTTGAADGTAGSLSAGDFNLNNFVLGTLALAGDTTVTYTADSELYLGSSLTITAGSVLVFDDFANGEAEIHVLDPNGTMQAQAAAYISGGQILNAFIIPTPGVGFTLSNIPEPGALGLLALGGLLLIRRRR